MTMAFESLTKVLEGLFDKPLADLPSHLRERISADFAHLRQDWDCLNAEQRRNVAEQCDNDRDWDEASVDWDYWRKPETLTAHEFCCLRHILDPRNYQKERGQIPGGSGKALGARVNDDMRIIERSLGANAKKPVRDWVLWALQQHWVIPSYLLSTGAEQEGAIDAGHYASNDPCILFQSMKLTADEVTIIFIGDMNDSSDGTSNMLQISARDKSARVPLAALDLIDRRRSNSRLNKQGGVLLGLTKRQNLNFSQSNAKLISRLRKTIKKYLAISDDPFETHHNGGGWVPRIKIIDKRGAADERARLEAERHTVSIDEMEEKGAQFSGSSQESEPADELNRLIEEQKRDQDS